VGPLERPTGRVDQRRHEVKDVVRNPEAQTEVQAPFEPVKELSHDFLLCYTVSPGSLQCLKKELSFQKTELQIFNPMVLCVPTGGSCPAWG